MASVFVSPRAPSQLIGDAPVRARPESLRRLRMIATRPLEISRHVYERFWLNFGLDHEALSQQHARRKLG